MPRQVKARAAQDTQEERLVRRLAGSHHAPADWKLHAQMVVESWAGKTPNEVAAELGCHPQTVRIHLKRFTLEGVAGRGMRAGSGRKARPTEPWWPEMKRVQPSGRSMRWPRPPKKRGFRSNAARSGAFTCGKGCAGVAPTVGGIAMTRISSQKDSGRLPLHAAARGLDDRLHR